MKQILIETLSFKVDPTIITESISKNNGRMIIPNMIIQRADVPNKNRRIYSKKILEREGSKLITAAKQTDSAGILGELDHPDSSVINLKNACIGILDYRWKGNDMLGDVQILRTPSGNILRSIIDDGFVPGISSRGMGSVKNLYENDDPDLVEVDDDFEMLTWDAVSDPSTHAAFFKTVSGQRVPPPGMNEGKAAKNYYFPETKYDRVNSIILDIICENTGVCCLK